MRVTVNYVDLQKRQEEQLEKASQPTSLSEGAETNPYFVLAAGFALGVPASGLAFASSSSRFASLILIIPLIFLALVGMGTRHHLQHQRPRRTKPKLGKEKQLLMTMLNAGGSITPVEAALETSLTVDEAEEMLSRLTERGHLHVESRDGALFYVLPGRRGLEESTAPSG